MRTLEFRNKILDVLRLSLLRNIQVELVSGQWLHKPACLMRGMGERSMMMNAIIWMTLNHECGTSLRERSHGGNRTTIFRSAIGREPFQEGSERKKQSEELVIVWKSEDR